MDFAKNLHFSSRNFAFFEMWEQCSDISCTAARKGMTVMWASLTVGNKKDEHGQNRTNHYNTVPTANIISF